MKKLKNSILLLLTLSLVITATVNLSPAYANPTALYVDPFKTSGLPKDSTFPIDIEVMQDVSFVAFAFKLAYDPSVLNAISITKGSLFEGMGIGVAPHGPLIQLKNEINNDLGYVLYSLIFGDWSPYFTDGISVWGTLATITFKVVTDGGATILDPIGTALVAPDGTSIDHEVTPGIFYNLPTAPPITRIVASSTKPQIEENVKFSADVIIGEGASSIVSYFWDWGDGSDPDNDAIPGEYSLDHHGMPTPDTDHTYYDVGTYVVKLTVTDDKGMLGRASATITVTPPRGFKADIVDAWPAIRNIKLTYPPEEAWWHTTFVPFYADVVNLAQEGVMIKVRFTVTLGGSTVAEFEPIDSAGYAYIPSYLTESRFDTSDPIGWSPVQFETKGLSTGSYVVDATCFYLSEGTSGEWLKASTRTFKLRITP